jgi:glucose-6-phosphate isomerase
MITMSNPKTCSSWHALSQLKKEISNSRLSSLFHHEGSRFERFSIEVGSLFVDYSKNFINQQIFAQLINLAREQKVDHAIDCLVAAHQPTQNVPSVPYIAIRDPALPPIILDGVDIASDIRNTRFRISRMCNDIRSWNWRGFSEKPLTDIVVLGVGGAANGTHAVCNALYGFQTGSIRSHFITSADSHNLNQLLSQLQRDTTLFVISSKSFSTHETLHNANIAKQWATGAGANNLVMERHFVAITANQNAARSFGIEPNNTLPVWDWLPSRYSLWSSAGLPIALSVGMERFEQLLAGANAMDQHFSQAPLEKNLPVIMAMLSVWYINFWDAPHHAILPYNETLDLLPGFVQHCLMEANGKSVDREGQEVDYNTAPVIWGAAGSSGQHTYFQLLHQGTHTIPADFITAVREPLLGDNHTVFTQLLAQTEALMMGDREGTILDQGAPLQEKHLPGNKPSTSILMKELSPYCLGQLLSLYEHISFVQSTVWNLNPFSHWGTELSKRYSNSFAHEKDAAHTQTKHDPSTLGLLQQFKKWSQAPAPEQSTLEQEIEENSYPFF